MDFISRVIFSRVQDEEQAKDILQDFYLSVISRPPPKNVGDIRSYLYKALINDIADASRRLQTYKAYISKYREEINITSIIDSDAETKLIEDEQKKLMFEFILEQLPASSSIAIAYRFKNDHSIKKIAETMGVKRTSVSRYISDGLKTLRKILSEKYDIPNDRTDI